MIQFCESSGGRLQFEHGGKLIRSMMEKSKARPTSVKVTNYPDRNSTNPEPVSQSTVIGIEGFLSQQLLRELTGVSNLVTVKTLELSVDTRVTSIGSMGAMVPSLERLKFIDSYIPSIRDLGTGFSGLKCLFLSRCGMEDLDGICCFSALQELYLPYNDVTDLSSVSMLESLEILDVEGNGIDDISQIEFLAFCPNLSSLVLDGNPVKNSPSPNSSEEECKAYRYRKTIASAVPQLHYLDDKMILYETVNGQRILKESQGAWSEESGFQQENSIITDSIKYSDQDLLEEEDSEEDVPISPNGDASNINNDAASLRVSTRPLSRSGRPLSAMRTSRPMSSVGLGRPRTAMSTGRPASALSIARPKTAGRSSRQSSLADDFYYRMERPGTGSHSSSSRDTVSPTYSSPENLEEDGCSELTHGSKEVFCGNPVRALLARRKELMAVPTSSQFSSRGASAISNRSDNTKPRGFVPERTYYLQEEENVDQKDVLQELKEWRLNFSKHFESGRSSTGVSSADDRYQSDNRDTATSPTPPSVRRKAQVEGASSSSSLLSNTDGVERPRTVASYRSRRYRTAGSEVNSSDGSVSPSSNPPPLKPSLYSPKLQGKLQSQSPPTDRASRASESGPVFYATHRKFAGSNGSRARPLTAVAAMKRTGGKSTS